MLLNLQQWPPVDASNLCPDYLNIFQLKQLYMVYCYRPSSAVCRLPRSWALQNGWTDQDDVLVVDLGGPKKSCIWWECTGATWRIPPTRPCAAAMRPLVIIIITTFAQKIHHQHPRIHYGFDYDSERHECSYAASVRYKWHTCTAAILAQQTALAWDVRCNILQLQVFRSHKSASKQGRNQWGVGEVRTPPNLDGPPQPFWWRVWLPLRNRLQCTKLGIPSVFCSVQ